MSKPCRGDAGWEFVGILNPSGTPEMCVQGTAEGCFNQTSPSSHRGRKGLPGSSRFLESPGVSRKAGEGSEGRGAALPARRAKSSPSCDAKSLLPPRRVINASVSN